MALQYSWSRPLAHLFSRQASPHVQLGQGNESSKEELHRMINHITSYDII